MKQIAPLAVLMMLNSFAFSQTSLPSSAPQQMTLDTISFQTSAKQWVTTQTALLSVNINITLSDANVVKARAHIMESLDKIAQGEWHLTQFERSQDSSGLEKLFVQAQIRVPQNLSTNVYQRAKTISQSGAQYIINGIEFKPSLEEVQKIRALVRNQLHQQITSELMQINKIYPNQKYTLSNLVIVDGEGSVPPVASRAKNAVLFASGASTATLVPVSNELVLTAYVEVASTRRQEN